MGRDAVPVGSARHRAWPRGPRFGPHAALFGEPAWDLMLDLYVAMVEGKRISITSASVASCSPPSTAIRHVGFLERDGLAVRSQDDRDRRRSHVALSAEAVRMMDDWLDRTADDRD